MTPKEKAKDLVFKYDFLQAVIEGFSFYDDKQCAIIAVDEIIKETKLHDKTIYQHGRTAYWQEVKQQIENL